MKMNKKVFLGAVALTGLVQNVNASNSCFYYTPPANGSFEYWTYKRNITPSDGITPLSRIMEQRAMAISENKNTLYPDWISHNELTNLFMVKKYGDYGGNLMVLSCLMSRQFYAGKYIVQ